MSDSEKTEKVPDPTVVQLEVRNENDEAIAAFDMEFSNEVGAPPAYDLQIMSSTGSAFARVAKDSPLVILRVPVPVKAGKVQKREEPAPPPIEGDPKEEDKKDKEETKVTSKK